MSGYMIMLNGGPVAWSSRKQPIIALSTAEAEYIGSRTRGALLTVTRQRAVRYPLLVDPCLLQQPSSHSVSVEQQVPCTHQAHRHLLSLCPCTRQEWDIRASILPNRRQCSRRVHQATSTPTPPEASNHDGARSRSRGSVGFRGKHVISSATNKGVSGRCGR
jgi:hypothetical protein